MTDRHVIAIIPARGGSKGIPKKNIVPIAGKPLIAYAIEAARASGVYTHVIVSTDCDEIAQVAGKYGAMVIKRPEELASDTALTEPVLMHVLDEYVREYGEPTHISLIQCTSPFLSKEVICEVGKKVFDEGHDACITAFNPGGYEFKWKRHDEGHGVPEHDVENRPRRQDLDLPLHENGACYMVRTDLFRKTQNRFGGREARVGIVEMPEIDSIQIDSEEHLAIVDAIMQIRNRK